MTNTSTPSPWKKSGVSINKVLGSSKAPTTEREKKTFKLVGDYVDRVKWKGEKPEAVQKDLKDKFKEAEK